MFGEVFLKKVPPCKNLPCIKSEIDLILDTCFLSKKANSPKNIPPGWPKFLHSKNRKKKPNELPRDCWVPTIEIWGLELGFFFTDLQREVRPRELPPCCCRGKCCQFWLKSTSKKVEFQMCWDLVVRSKSQISDEESYRKSDAIWIWVANRYHQILCANMMLHYVISCYIIVYRVLPLCCSYIYYLMLYYLLWYVILSYIVLHYYVIWWYIILYSIHCILLNGF